MTGLLRCANWSVASRLVKVGVFDDTSGIIFLISQKKNIRCGYSFEDPLQGTSEEYPQHIFFTENLRKLSQNYLQVLFLNNFTGIFDDWKGVRVGVGGG